MSDDLVAVCDVCLSEIPDGSGVLEVDTGAAEASVRRWRARVGADPLAVLHLDRRARVVAWRVRHHDCGHAPRVGLQIAVERVRSWPALLDWSVHLSDKSWLSGTDWHDLVSRALNPRRGAVSGILPSTPRDLAGGPVGDH